MPVDTQLSRAKTGEWVIVIRDVSTELLDRVGLSLD